MNDRILSLSSPLSLPCGAVIPNRIGKSAMTEGLADADDNPTPAHNKLHETWSKGGAGLHISGNVMIDRRYLERAGNIVLEDDSAIAAFTEMANAGEVGGNQFWMQINHPGRQCPRMVNSEPLAPSEVQLKMLGNFSRPRAMSNDEIEDVITRFATTAGLAKKAGFSGVQVHCAHGYLISQFLNPLVNKRTDQWGGSLENRARLVRRVIRSVREAVGPNFPVAAKLNSADFQKGGFTLEECVIVAKWLAEDSLDLLEISGGNYEQLSLMGVESTEVRESTRKREAYFLEYAEAIRLAAQIPLMITGGFRSREVMEKAVANKEIDMVGLARPFCTQVDLARKLIDKSIDQVDSYENELVLGSGLMGNNSPLSLIKSINTIGAVGFYYWQIILLSKGLPVDPSLKIIRSFAKHMANDFRLNMRRKKSR